MVSVMKKAIKKATIKSLSADELLRAMGISKKKEAEILKKYAAARKRALAKEARKRGLSQAQHTNGA